LGLSGPSQSEAAAAAALSGLQAETVGASVRPEGGLDQTAGIIGDAAVGDEDAARSEVQGGARDLGGDGADIRPVSRMARSNTRAALTNHHDEDEDEEN